MGTALSRGIRLWTRPVLAVVLAVIASTAAAQLPFFPGAEGFGGSFLGTPTGDDWFENATIYHVTNLNDTGSGSLRDAFDENSSNKIIVFDIAGTIKLTSGVLDIKNLSNYYIAGQTAPGPVTIYGDTTQINHSPGTYNTNIVLRYLTFRKGTASGNTDTLTFKGGPSNDPSSEPVGRHMILDHVSVSWAEDENLSIANHNTDITVQNSIISDALDGVGDHAFGSLVRPRKDSSVTIHHNLYANNRSRQPRLGTYFGQLLTADVRNNVVYNWSDRATYAGGSSSGDTEQVDMNYVGNYLIAGPATVSNSTTAVVVDRRVHVDAYQSGNKIDPDDAPGGAPADGEVDGTDTGWGMWAVADVEPLGTLVMLGSPVSTAPVTTQTADATYDSIMTHVGNWWWERDDIDARVIGNVENFTSPSNGVSAPEPIGTEEDYVTEAAATFHPGGWDTDGDAMPDYWEEEHGLNPNSSSDYDGDFDDDGYINLIEYINDRGAFPAPTPIIFTGDTDSSYAKISNWKTGDGGITTGSNWQPSKYDEVQVDGTAVVSHVGQHAGTVKIGNHPGDNATLSIIDGWLKVEDASSGLGTGEVIIGADNAATAALNLSGGELYTSTLSKGTGGTFNFTGGVLHAETVTFDLEVGGTLSPGASVGQTHVQGNLDLAGGNLEIELESATTADFVEVDDTATLGGDLVVGLLDGYSPTSGNWLIMTAGAFDGAFASITAGYSLSFQGNDMFLMLGATLPGDYNEDGKVSAADYTVFMDTYGSTTDLRADGSSSNYGVPDGLVDDYDYQFWKDNYGMTSGSGSGSGQSLAAVPEPGTLVLLLVGIAAIVARRIRG